MSTIRKSVILNLANAHRNTFVQRQRNLGIVPNKNQKNMDFEPARRILSSFVAKKLDHPYKKVHTFYNFKGGTGKTTICYQVSEFLSLFGYNVLAIDLDPQSHLTNLLLKPGESVEYNLHDIIFNGRNPDEVIKHIHEGFDLLPATLGLTKMEISLSQRPKREEQLQKLLKVVGKDYDFILIDTNPAISNLNINAIFAADCINIVCETQPLSLNGLSMVLEELKILAEQLEIDCYYKIIPNKYDIKTTISQEILGFLKTEYRDVVTENIIRRSEDFNISTKLKVPLFYLPKVFSPAHEDIRDLVTELIEYSINKEHVVEETNKKTKHKEVV